MARVIALEPRRTRYTAAIGCEAWLEMAEAARRLVAFTEAELRTSFAGGDVRRLRVLQAAHQDAARIVSEGRRMAGWADAASCADHVAAPGHGRAA